MNSKTFVFQKRTFNLRLAASCLLLPLLGMPLLTGCPRVPTNVTSTPVGIQNDSKISLKVNFALSDPRPDYLSKIKKIQIKLTSRSSNSPVDDSFEANITATTTDLARTLSNVPTGQIDVEVHLFDADSKDVVPTLTSSFSLTKDTTDAMVVKLEASPKIVPPQIPATNLSSLRQQRRDLLIDIQTQASKENDILRQLSGLRSSPNIEDQTLRQQLQAELQVLQTQRQNKENLLADLNTQLTRLESQSNSTGAPEIQDQVFQLRQQSSQLTTAIETNLKQRRLTSLEIKSLIRGEDPGRLTQLQGELQTMDKQIDDQILQLQLVNLQLQQLEAKLTSQAASLPAAERKPQIEANLALLKTQISSLETEIPTLKQRIDALVQATDLLSVQRRETLEAELKQKQADLDQAKSLQTDLQKELDSIK